MVATRRKAAGKTDSVQEGAAASVAVNMDEDALLREPSTPAEQAIAAEQAISQLLAKPTLLLTPSSKERDAVLKASALLFALSKSFRGGTDKKRGSSVGLSKLHTAGCDAEQVWGQLEVGGLTEHQNLKREVKTLLKTQDLVNLVAADEDEDETGDDDSETGSDDEMAKEAAKMRRLARGEEVSDMSGEDGEDDDSEDDGEEKGRKTSKRKAGKKSGSDEFWDDMEKFVQQGEEEQAEEEEELTGKKKADRRAVDVTLANADNIEFVVAGCGTDDVEGVYRRNSKICKFGVAYSKGAYTLLFEHGGTKLTKRI